MRYRLAQHGGDDMKSDVVATRDPEFSEDCQGDFGLVKWSGQCTAKGGLKRKSSWWAFSNSARA